MSRLPETDDSKFPAKRIQENMKQRAVDSPATEKLIVAVKADKVISKTALAWALIHVVHPGDCITLLAVLSGHKTGRRSLWSFPRLTGDCGTGNRDKCPERISQISHSCSQMILQLHDQIQDLIGPGLNQTHDREYMFNSTIRKAVSLGRTSSIPPPLCSLCQHKAPVFGKPPRRFNYEELKEATDGFSDMNFIADGGFGTVHRGVLKDGQVIAVKQLKFSGSQGDTDFCREVRVLSCAQHRNVVLLIGFCVEGKHRVLVYEYICNGSLNFHLHGNERTHLDWDSRQKIAIGAARGLRYLHEDCRVGCIVHRDMRPSNILLTHDYEPLVADFGLARLHTEWDICDERVVGTSGYLAPEYFNGGKITEKVDVYEFGLVLLELITGQKTSDIMQCQEGRHILAENFYPLSIPEHGHILANRYQLLDPCFASNQLHNLPQEVRAMGHAAFLCLQQDPESRPIMSKVLRILGGDGVIPLGLDLNSVGSRSGHMRGLSSNVQLESRKHSRRLSY